MLPNSDIINFPLSTDIVVGDYIVKQNETTGITERILASSVLPVSDQNFAWVSNATYALDESVTYGGDWYISLQNGNLGNIPQVPSLFWALVTKNSGGFKPWSVGIYNETVIFITHVFAFDTPENFLLKLIDNTRPFYSSDLLQEISQGKWQFVGGGQKKFVAADITGEGLIVNDVVTAKVAGANPFKKWVVGDVALGFVKLTVGNFGLIEVLGSVGNSASTPFPLTKGSKYYVQANGSVGLTITSTLAFMAISTTAWVSVVNQGSGGGGADLSRRVPFRFNSNLFTEQTLSFRGIISAISNSLTNELTSVAYESRLDTSSVYTPHLNLAALQTWINTFITGTEASGTKYWIKVLATYSPSGGGESENILTFTGS